MPMSFWEFLKWFIEKLLDPFGWLERLLLAVIQRYRLSKAMAFNVIFELMALALVALYSLVAAFRPDIPSPFAALQIWMLGALACALLVVSERLWAK
jgi:hypothetical protein